MIEAIDNMSADERLRLVEALWESLSREEAGLESPSWHKKALLETVARHNAGEELQIHWEAAKRELRNRAG